MKTKSYTKIGVWLVVVSLIVAFSALNPERAKRIACKVVVFLEIYDSMKECQYGCEGNKKKDKKEEKPLPKGKKSVESKPQKKPPKNVPSNCLSNQLRFSFLGFESTHLLALTFVHFVVFLVIKGITWTLGMQSTKN